MELENLALHSFDSITIYKISIKIYSYYTFVHFPGEFLHSRGALGPQTGIDIYIVHIPSKYKGTMYTFQMHFW